MKSQAIRDAEYDVDRLFCWADNENHPSTYLIFLVLTGHLEAEFIRPLGHLEASLLAKALRAWTVYPVHINDLIHKQQREVA
jgi:hypothetical protein